MAKKPNPVLAAFEAKLEAKYRQKLEINSELDLIAFMLTINDELKVGSGRAGRCVNAFLANKVEVADAILSDSESDKELLHTKQDLAKRLRSIFSKEDWETAKVWFPLLREYWED